MPEEILAVSGYREVYRLSLGTTVAFLAVHALVDGLAVGGLRIHDYPDEEHALEDALALARAMSRKTMIAGSLAGGAKTVMMAPGQGRADAVRRLGRFIESMGGRYWTGGDLGFGPEDMAALRAETSYVACADLAADTARTVQIAMKSVCSPDTVVVQGLGAVGRPLAERLRANGIRVLASDLQSSDGFERVPPDDVYATDCDVFAPCAVGGVLDETTIPELRCSTVCGGANNPLATEDDARRLHRRGIFYVPDFLANCGATIRGVAGVRGDTDRFEADLLQVGDTARELLERSQAEDRSPHFMAVEMAERRLASLMD